MSPMHSASHHRLLRAVSLAPLVSSSADNDVAVCAFSDLTKPAMGLKNGSEASPSDEPLSRNKESTLGYSPTSSKMIDSEVDTIPPSCLILAKAMDISSLLQEDTPSAKT